MARAKPQPSDKAPRDLKSGPPAGMKKRSSEGGAPWVRKIEGAIVCGALLGRFRRSQLNEKGEAQHYYQVKLAGEVEVQATGGEVRVAEAGEIVNLDENKQLETLQDAIKEGDLNVWVRYVTKKKLQSGRGSFWEIEVYSSPVEIDF